MDRPLRGGLPFDYVEWSSWAMTAITATMATAIQRRRSPGTNA